MKWPLSRDRLRFAMRRIRERLWIKPLLICIVSIIAVFGSKVSDNLSLARLAPDVSSESVESLLSIMAASMLAIATFAVASMVSAYSSASTTATPLSRAAWIACFTRGEISCCGLSSVPSISIAISLIAIPSSLAKSLLPC